MSGRLVLAMASAVFTMAVGGSPQPASADTSSQLFVERAYHDLLGRTPDAAALSSYATALDHGTLAPLDVANAITGSDEFHGDEVSQQYQAIVRRNVDSMDFNFWVGVMRAGTTVEQLQSTLAGSSEYFLNFGGGTNSGFLTALYPDLLGRPISQPESSYDTLLLNSGESRSALASGILASVEYDQRLVNGYYPRFLHRGADPQAVAFVNELQQGVRDEQVISQIVGSPEYYNLPLLPGDSNFDQVVNFTDLLTLAQHYGQTNAHWFDGDFTGDGTVGFGDLLALAQHYGRSTAAISQASVAAVPEPTRAVLGSAACLALLTRRRRRALSS